MGLALLLAVLIGAVLGTLGSGGSILLVPVLVHVAGMPGHRAVETSLMVIAASSLLAAALHYRQGNYHPKALLLFGTTGPAGAWAGSAGTHRVAEPVLMLLFAAVMALAGGAMLWRRASRDSAEGCRLVRCALIGLGVGALTGFLGVGGGFLLMPALVLAAGIQTHKAVGTSLAVISINSFAGLLGQMRYGPVDLGGALALIGLMTPGVAAGAALARRLPPRTLRISFGVLLLALSLTLGLLNASRL